MLLMKRTLLVLSLFIIFITNCSSASVVNWGGKCQFTAECGDHRLVCEEVTIKNVTEKICVCDRFHKWNGTLVGCALNYKTEDILAMIEEKYNVAARIQYEADLVFTAQIIAGLIVLGVGMVCTITVTAYCYRMWKQDTDLENIVKRMESQKQNNKPATSRRS